MNQTLVDAADRAATPDPLEEPGGRAPAPEPLRLVQEFLNTNDIEGGTDTFATVAGLRSWLAGYGLLEAHARLTGRDRDLVVAVREALRDAVGANLGLPVPQASVRLLNDLRGPLLRVEFSPSGEPDVRRAATGLDGALAGILERVFRAAADGSWRRLKVCQRDACRWVFYDHSKNRSGTWCTMAICGSRTKALSYYRRRTAASTR